MKRRIAIAVALLLGLYIAGPIVAGSFRVGDRTGPMIYPESFHTTLYILAHEGAHDGEKPRTPIDSWMYERPWFYGLPRRLKPAHEREAIVLRQGNSRAAEMLRKMNHEVESRPAGE